MYCCSIEHHESVSMLSPVYKANPHGRCLSFWTKKLTRTVNIAVILRDKEGHETFVEHMSPSSTWTFYRFNVRERTDFQVYTRNIARFLRSVDPKCYLFYVYRNCYQLMLGEQFSEISQQSFSRLGVAFCNVYSYVYSAAKTPERLKDTLLSIYDFIFVVVLLLVCLIVCALLSAFCFASCAFWFIVILSKKKFFSEIFHDQNEFVILL